MSEIERPTSGKALRVGDKIRMQVPPPLTWWDNLLWRVFRIERKRAPVTQEFVVTYTVPSETKR